MSTSFPLVAEVLSVLFAHHPFLEAYLRQVVLSGLALVTWFIARRTWRVLRPRPRAARHPSPRFTYDCVRCLTEVRTNWRQRRCHRCQKRFDES